VRLVDRLILGYVAVVSVAAIWRAQNDPSCWWLLPGHALIVLLVFLVQRPGLGAIGRFFRETYPIFLLASFYGELDVLNGGGVRIHDALVQGWEEALFGMQVSREWWRRMPSRFWSTVLHGAYWGYYILLPLPVIVFVVQGNRRALQRTILMVIGTFLFCYLCFVFLPVVGPYYEFPRPDAWFLDNPMARLVYRTLEGGSSYGAAFPSSHVAATITATAGAWYGSRRLAMIMLLPTALLTIGVVYCQMHYAVDALAGVLVGGIAWWLGGRLRAED
jgi:membrane-associated phospholipid phosphatase